MGMLRKRPSCCRQRHLRRRLVATAAAGQYRGYALQTVRVCAHLLAAEDGNRVRVEHYDDVGTERPSFARLLEQLMSATSHNPVSDWAEDLWKSFAHWLELCVSGRVDAAASRFRLYLMQNHTGDLVRRLPARGGLPKGAGPHLERFLACEPELRALIVRNSSGRPVPATALAFSKYGVRCGHRRGGRRGAWLGQAARRGAAEDGKHRLDRGDAIQVVAEGLAAPPRPRSCSGLARSSDLLLLNVQCGPAQAIRSM